MFGFLLQALRHVRQIAQETSGEVQYGGGRQPAVLRTFSQKLSRYASPSFKIASLPCVLILLFLIVQNE